MCIKKKKSFLQAGSFSSITATVCYICCEDLTPTVTLTGILEIAVLELDFLVKGTCHCVVSSVFYRKHVSITARKAEFRPIFIAVQQPPQPLTLKMVLWKDEPNKVMGG